MNYESHLTLEAAVKSKSASKVRQVLEEGVDPNLSEGFWWSASCPSIALSSLKLLLHHGLEVKDDFLHYIFQSQHLEELLALIIHRNLDARLLEKIFVRLVYSDCEASSSLRILNLLLDHGFPIDGLIEDDGMDVWTGGSIPPLHLAILENNMDLVESLLRRGADVNKKTSLRITNLFLAVNMGRKKIVKVLLRHGADVNALTGDRELTALHVLDEDDLDHETLRLILDHGADLNLKDCLGQTPLIWLQKPETEETLVKELAMSKFVCEENMNYLRQRTDLQEIFDDCLEELRRMKEHRFYNHFSLYDVLDMRSRRKKLTLLTENKDFVEAFRVLWNRESFKLYANDLDDIVEEAVRRRDVLLMEEKKLRPVFDGLPQLVLRKIVLDTNEELFF